MQKCISGWLHIAPLDVFAGVMDERLTFMATLRRRDVVMKRWTSVADDSSFT